MPSVWSNMIPAFTDVDSVTLGAPGRLQWLLVNSFIDNEPGSVSSSSASEFVSPCASGGYYVTTDEVFGAGLLRLG